MIRKKVVIIVSAAAVCVLIAGILVIMKDNKQAGLNDAVSSTSYNNSKNNSKNQSKSGESGNKKNLQMDKEFQMKKSKGESKTAYSSASEANKTSYSQSAAVSPQASQQQAEKNSYDEIQTFQGYITTEDDFAAGLKQDTADMVYMKLMAQSGLGITFEHNGEWVFYYFDGAIAGNNTSGGDGKWTFDGSGSQLNAWNIVGQKIEEGKGKSAVSVTVKGALKGNTQTNQGSDADGKQFPVITVSSIENN